MNGLTAEAIATRRVSDVETLTIIQNGGRFPVHKAHFMGESRYPIRGLLSSISSCI
jgi:hypothetical protein